MVLACQRPRKVVVGDGFDLTAEDLDFDDGWLPSTIGMKMMVIETPAVEFGKPKYVHYALVEIHGGSCINWGGEHGIGGGSQWCNW